MSKVAAIVLNDNASTVDFAAIAEFPNETFAHYLIGTREERGSRDGIILTLNQKVPLDEVGTDQEFHTHPRDQIFYMISGEMMVEIEGQEPFLVKSGDMVKQPAGISHRNWVVGPENVTHLQINGVGLL